MGQVQHGPAQGIWLHLNPRTGRDYFHGHVEPEVQVALGKYLRPGMTVSVDECVHKSGAPDFIKCDVEGAEVEVFRGAEQLLNERRPIILCEMHGEKNRKTLLKMFENLGYRSL